jgi:hypothetical protein
LNSTLIATANNDVLVGLDINPTFTNGAFTGIKNIGLRVGTFNYDLANQRLGLGTNIPTDNVELITSVTTGIAIHSSGSGVNSRTYLNLARVPSIGSTSETGWQFIKDASDNLVFKSLVSGAATDRIYLFTTGNLGINQTTDSGFKLDVNGTTRLQGNTTISGDNNLIFQRATDGNSLLGIELRGSGGAERGAFKINMSTGELRIGATTGGGFFPTFYTNGVEGGRFTTGGTFQTTASVTAASAIARGVYFNNTLVASANSDVLVGLDINPTFTNGAFTGVTNVALRVQGTPASTTSPFVQILNNASTVAANQDIVQILTPNVANGVSFQPIRIGTAASGLNSFSIGYTHVSSGSTSNRVNMSFFGQNNLQVYFASGNIAMGGQTTDAGYKLDVNGTARVQSDMIVNTITVGRGGGAVSTNTALGYQAGNANTTGNNNFFGGYLSGALNTTAGGNTYLGAYAGANGTSNVNNSNNTYVGMATGYSVGGVSSSNIMIGYYAGRYITGGVTEQTLTNFSIFIGDNTKALANNQTNQIVIGSSATGLGSNTTVIGNSSTTFGRWYGRLLLGTSTDAGYGLDINGTARVQTSLTVGTTAIISTEQAIISNSAAQQLRLFNTGTTAGTQAQLTFTTNLANTSSAIAAILLSSGNQTLSFFTPNAGTVAEKLRIWNNGNVLIQNGGTFTDTGFLFDVNGTTRLQSTLTVGSTALIGTEQAIISNSAAQQLRLYNSSTTAGAQAQLTFTTNTNGAISSAISAISLDNSGNQTLSFLTSNTGTAGERLRIWNTGNVHIQNGGTYTDVASSILTMNSTTKGFLPPRMTTTQRNAIATPAAGLMVYDTTLNLMAYYNGTLWITF